MTDAHAADSLSVEPHRFAMVPEWVIDADIGDCAFRLYAVLLRYGHTSGHRMPSRKTLARRLHKSVDTVDRALKELVALGAVVVERRSREGENLTNAYHLRTSDPGGAGPAGPGRTAAAPHGTGAATGGRTGATRSAAEMRPDPEPLTESIPSPTVRALASRCREERERRGLGNQRWSDVAVQRALVRAGARGWPPDELERALLIVACDPETVSPMRCAEAGTWWSPSTPSSGADVTELEAELDAVDGHRARLQGEARERLRRQGALLTRASVVREAVRLLRAEQAAGETRD